MVFLDGMFFWYEDYIVSMLLKCDLDEIEIWLFFFVRCRVF